MRIEEICLNEKRNVRLSAWIQEVGGEISPIENRPAILILPGGGYSMCSDREADPVAAAYLKAGYQAFILRYSVGEHKAWPNPLNDYEQTMELIKGNAETWHVDVERIAVIGFSAGGHLAACAATVARNRPSAAILGYAAMKKEICDICQPGMPYPVEHVDEKTPPCFLFATRDDYVVDISNTIEFQKSLAGYGIAFESHIYSFGMHGFSTAETYLKQAKTSKRVSNWVQDSIDWLAEIWGAFTNIGFDEPVCSKKVSADYENMLCLECSFRHLKKQSGEVHEILKEYITAVESAIAERFDDAGIVKGVLDGYKFSDLLQMLKVPEEVLHSLDTALRKCPNQLK